MLSVRQNRYIEEKEMTDLTDAAFLTSRSHSRRRWKKIN